MYFSLSSCILCAISISFLMPFLLLGLSSCGCHGTRPLLWSTHLWLPTGVSLPQTWWFLWWAEKAGQSWRPGCGRCSDRDSWRHHRVQVNQSSGGQRLHFSQAPNWPLCHCNISSQKEIVLFSSRVSTPRLVGWGFNPRLGHTKHCQKTRD